MREINCFRTARSINTRTKPAAAFVLISILIVVMLISMVALSLLFRMRAEEKAAVASAGGEQAWAAAMSGIRHAMLILADSPVPEDWRDNPTVFKDQFVFDDGAQRWYFSVFSPGTDETATVRFGLADEAGKLNVNLATNESISAFPLVTLAMAQALADFVDADEQPRGEGAEQIYYDTLENPYTIHNGPLNTLDELFMVRGFTPALLYGEDANQNFRLDANEDDGDASFPPDNSNGELARGLRQHLTVASYDLNLDSAGVERVDLNNPDASLSDESLPEVTANFIAAARRNQITITNVCDLVDVTWTMPDEEGQNREYHSGIDAESLPLLVDRFTHTNAHSLPGLINLNTASAEVLATVPGIDGSLANEIIGARDAISMASRDSIAWLLTEQFVDAEAFRQMGRFLTTRSYQFSLRVAGFASSGQYRIIEAIIDSAGDEPRIIYLRDVSRFGLPFPIDLPDAEQSSAELESQNLSFRPPPSRPALGFPERPQRHMLNRPAQSHHDRRGSQT